MFFYIFIDNIKGHHMIGLLSQCTLVAMRLYASISRLFFAISKGESYSYQNKQKEGHINLFYVLSTSIAKIDETICCHLYHGSNRNIYSIITRVRLLTFGPHLTRLIESLFRGIWVICRHFSFICYYYSSASNEAPAQVGLGGQMYAASPEVFVLLTEHEGLLQ